MKNFYTTLLLIVSMSLGFSTLAQNYNMSNATINGCSGTFYDPGGTGNYAAGIGLITMTFCSSTADEINLDFTSLPFQVETNFDFLNIYDGVGTGGTNLWNSQTQGGAVNPGLITSTTGCLTITFSSDGSVQYTGWEAVVFCGTPSCTDGLLNNGETSIDCGGPNCAPCPSCNDGIQNNGETGIDCGGPNCTPCSCFDGVQNNGETDIDCGGPSCNACPVPCAINLTYTTIPDPLECNGGDVFLVADGEGEHDLAMNNDFNGGTVGNGWVSTGGSAVGAPCGPSLDGTDYYWASTAIGTPNLTTSELDVSCGGILSFDMTYATQGGAAPCEGPDEPDEGVTFQYSIDGGVTWIILGYWDPVGGMDPILTAWNNYNFTIPPGAIGPNTQFQWIQLNSSGTCCDNWGIDNVSISSTTSCDPYFYNYDHVFGTDNNSIQNESITSTTDYGVWYGNGIDSCYAAITIIVPPGTTADAGPDQVFCTGGPAVTIGADPVTPDAGAVYTWSTGATGTIVLTGVGQDNGQINVTPAVTTDYFLEVEFNGCKAYDTVTVTVDVPPTASNPANINVQCLGDVPAANVNVVTTEADDFTIPPAVTHVGDVSDGLTCPETITRTYRVTDGCGNFVDVVQLIIIDDTQVPVMNGPPAAVLVQCSGDVPAMINLGWTDNCDGAGNVAGNDVSDGLLCPETITRTWTYTDACGNASIAATQTITVNDTQVPVFAAPPANVTVQCVGDIPAMTNLGWTDNCDGAANVGGVDGALTGGPCGGTITRTWTYTDACGNNATVTQTITVDDTTPPTATNPLPQLGVPPVFDPLQITDEADNCSVPTVTNGGDVSDGGNCPEIITRTYIITDACGNTINVIQTFTIGDAILPTASNPLAVNVQCNGDIPATDPTVVTDEADNGALPIVTWEDDTSDGLTCPETILRRYRVTDNCGNFIFVTQTITVMDITAPIMNAPPVALAVQCIGDVPAMIDLGYTDNCDAPGMVTGADVSDGLTCPETIIRTWTFTDACGNNVTETQTITVQDTQVPVFAAPPAALTVECTGDVPAMTDLGWTDNCDGAGDVTGADGALIGGACGGTITRTWTFTDACGNNAIVTQTITVDDTTLPTASNPATTTVPGGPAPAVDITVVIDEADNCTVNPVVVFVSEVSDNNACPETITRIYSVTDDCGNTINVTHLIIITDPFLPTASNPLPINVECIGDVPTADVLVVTDEADNQGVPVVAFVGDVSDGLTCPETITRTFSVTDVCGGQITVEQTITVMDITLPVMDAPPAAVAVQCIGDVPAMTDLAYTDNCDAAGVVTGADVSDGLTCPETITRSWFYTDACGNVSATVTQIITVQDTQVPVIAGTPAAVAVQCIGDVPAMIDLGYTDNCDAPGMVTGADVSDGLTCPETITRTWTFTDACGNNATEAQTITVQDTQVPVFAAPPAALTVECVGDVPAMTDLGWTDNCDGVGTVTGADGALTGGACGGTITRTWTFTDACGNNATVTQTITVDDTTLPTASNPATTTVPGGPAPAVDITVVIDEADNCTVNPVVVFVSESSDGNPCPETITRIYSVTDDCGNTINVTHLILITDPFLPTASNPIPINAECIGDVPAADVLVVTDEADNQGVPVVAFVGDVSDGLTCPETITRTFSVTDVCGGQITVEQTITVMDITLPVMNAPLAAVAVQCIGDVPAMTDLAYTDNCDAAGVVTGADVSDGLTCPETITRSWFYTDACGNVSATVTQIITVQDTQVPVIAGTPAAVAVQCIGDVPAMIDLGYTDNCDAPGMVTGADVSDGLTCPETITRTWTFTDACGNNATETQIITVQDTQVPVFAAPPAALTVECVGDVPAMTDLGWTDNCDGAGDVTGADGALIGGACGGTITRTWTFTDACGNNATVTQTITVDDTTLPTASNPATTTAPGGPIPAVDITVVIDEADNCTVNPVVAFVSEVSDNNPCPETITRVYSVTDDCGNTINVTHLIVITDPILPTGTAPAAVNVECIGDVPANDPLLIIDEADNQGVPVVAFVGDASDGLTCPETITRTYSITDVCGNVVLVTQLIIVNDVTNPTATAPATVNVECIGDVPAQNILDINDEADNCTVNPVVVFIGDVSDGLTCPETITRTYSITDDCGNQITVDQLIIVDDVTNPTGVAPATVNVECIGDVPVQNILDITTESDNCTVNPVVVFVGDVSDGLTCPETITRTYSITDDCGNQITVDQLIIVNDVTLPTASNPVTTTVPGGPTPAVDITVVIDEADNCTVNPVVALVSEVSDNNPCPETITRIYSVTDDCGNTINVTHLIVITDPILPTGTAPATVNVECIGDVPANEPLLIIDEADNQGVPVVDFVGDVSDGLTCPETITRTYSITDVCGNIVLVTQLIIVNDVTNPTASAPATVNVECIGDVPAQNILDITTESDNCTVNPVVVFVGDVSDGLTCPETITRTYSIADDCGNQITVDQLIIVNDVTLPTASNPAPISVPGSMNVPAPDPLVVIDELDNCTVNPAVVWVSDVSDGNVCNFEKITRTYSVTDDCGNQILVTQEITILAVPAPIDAGPDQLICAGELTTIVAVNPLNAPIVWSPVVPVGPFDPIQTTTYAVTADNLGCISTDDMTVVVEELPEVSFIGDVLSGCEPLEVTFTNTSSPVSGLTNCEWTINGETLNGCGNVAYNFENGGTYNVTLTTTSGTGCVNSVTYNDYIYVEDIPVASFTPSQTQLTNIFTEVVFTNNSVDATDYSWTFGDLTPSTSVENPTHSYPFDEGGSYLVELIAMSPLGCADTAYATINISEEVIYYVPNTFTPDGDAYNEYFKPIFTSGYDPYDFDLVIFNRWGETIWESHDSSIGWDGTYGADQKLVQDGTYSWRIEFKTTETDERTLITGHVNVLR